MKNFKSLKVLNGDINYFIERLSASNFKDDCSYLFFLSSNGRYFADCFYIRSLNIFVSKYTILQRLREYFLKMDLRKSLSFEFSNEKIFYSDTVIQNYNNYIDPRTKGTKFFLISSRPSFKSSFFDKNLYNSTRIEYELAEFDDFSSSSIVLNYGYIANFISYEKGCYPGKELICDFYKKSNKTVSVVHSIDESVIKVLLKFRSTFLVYKRI